MKKLFIALCGSVLLFSCKEKAPFINMSTAIVIDTTYTISPIPTADAHNVLVEDFTGASCSNCPYAHITLEGSVTSYPGRINILGLYIQNFSQTNPPAGAIYDFRDSVATQIGKNIYGGINSMPAAGVDRIAFGGSLIQSSGNWSADITTRLAVLDSINLAVTSSYDSLSNTDTITSTITYVSPVGYSHNLSVAIVEDSLIDIQEYQAFDPTYPSGFDNSYVFTNVFRGMASAGYAGDAVLPSLTVKVAGTVYRHIYIYHLPARVVHPKHVKVIAFVSSNVDHHILQSVQTPMTH